MGEDTKTIAIMQPTFLPWVGYFGLMDVVDEFVFLDHVQFDKRSWQQRNRIKTSNGPVWLSVPVQSKGKSDQAINEALIDQGNKIFPDKMVKTIEMNYSKAPFYNEYAQGVFDTLKGGHDKLLDLNIDLIEFFAGVWGIETKTSLSSSMNVEGQKSTLLVEVCNELGAKGYLSPPGSKEYIDASDDFEKAGIDVRYFEYNHPQWKQCFGEFEPYMSALDLLFHKGKEGIDTIREGYK
jgi:hypothetical protein